MLPLDSGDSQTLFLPFATGMNYRHTANLIVHEEHVGEKLCSQRLRVDLTETKQKKMKKNAKKHKMIKNHRDIWDGKGTLRWKKLLTNKLDSKLMFKSQQVTGLDLH